MLLTLFLLFRRPLLNRLTRRRSTALLPSPSTVEQVLTEDVTDKKKGGYFMKGLDGKETPIGPKEAQEIFNNIDKTETVFVDMNSKFRATRITFGPW